VTVEEATRRALLEWLAEGRRVVAATLVEVIGSAPLNPGAMMLVDAGGTVEGSVTGGCVEGALVEEAHRVFGGGDPGVVTYGVSDDLAGEVGLMCGGTVRILVSEITDVEAPVLTAALAAVEEKRPVALARLLDGPGAGRVLAVVEREHLGTLGGPELLDRSVRRDATGLLEQGATMIRRYAANGATMGDELRVHIEAFAPSPRMVIFGAIDFSAAVAKLAREVGYHVTICDARRPFLESRRFEAAHEVVADWPDRHLADTQFGEHDAILVFTHDQKFDEPALLSAVRTGAGYIGALGSRRTHEDRRRRLREAGMTEAQLDRIAGPCGLDIGASTPAETAISVLGEIIALRAGRSGGRLADGSCPIRRRAEATVP
jgi:xanthine dehydrogenase accessory factor